MKTWLKASGTLILGLTLVMAGCSQGGGTSTSGGAAAGGEVTPSQTQNAPEFPTKPVTLIVPFAPGGSTDLLARAMEKVSGKHLGEQLVIVNKAGGGGTIGWNELVAAKPDGYTLGSVSSSIALKPIYGDTKYNYVTDLEPIAWISTIPQVLAVKADSPWQTLDDFVKYAKENPGKIKYGHSGLGNTTHVAGETFAREADIQIEQVPFSSGSEVVTALLGGHIDATLATPADFQEHIKAGKLRPLAVATPERYEADPTYKDVPSFVEKGYQVEASSWNGIAAPKNLPENVKNTLAEAFKNLASDPEFIEQATNAGLNITYAGPEEFGAHWVKEHESLKKIITETGILEMVNSQKK